MVFFLISSFFFNMFSTLRHCFVLLYLISWSCSRSLYFISTICKKKNRAAKKNLSLQKLLCFGGNLKMPIAFQSECENFEKGTILNNRTALNYLKPPPSITSNSSNFKTSHRSVHPETIILALPLFKGTVTFFFI